VSSCRPRIAAGCTVGAAVWPEWSNDHATPLALGDGPLAASTPGGGQPLYRGDPVTTQTAMPHSFAGRGGSSGRVG